MENEVIIYHVIKCPFNVNCDSSVTIINDGMIRMKPNAEDDFFDISITVEKMKELINEFENNMKLILGVQNEFKNQ